MYVLNSNQKNTGSDSLNDEDLMLNYGRGDVEAFEELYRRNKGSLYRYFFRHLNQSSLAEEFSHEVWLRVIKARESYYPKAKFTTYLFHIAHNRVVDHFRKNSNIREVEIDDQNELEMVNGHKENPESKLEVDRGRQQLLSLVNLLPQEQREVFLLKEEAGLSIDDIADVTGENAEAVKSRMRYAVKKLKNGMQQYLNGQ